jgi:hypothetical protein
MQIGQNKWNTHEILNVSRRICDNLLVVYTFNRTMSQYGLKVVIRHTVGEGVGAMYLHMILDAPTKILHNTEDKPADQPPVKCVTPYCIHMLPLLNCHGWKQLIFKNVHICDLFCAMLQSTLCYYSVNFFVLMKAKGNFYAYAYIIYIDTHTHIHSIYTLITEHYIHI